MKIDRALLRKEVTVFLHHEEEDVDYRHGHFQREDGSNDDELCEWIRAQLDGGNYWAWCTARVEVVYKSLRTSAWVGGCSYESSEDFKKSGPYEDLVNEALDDLASTLEDIATAHIWQHDRVTCFRCVVAS